MVALGTAVERRRVDAVSGGPQAIHDWFPDPAPLIRAVNEHIRRHDRSLYRYRYIDIGPSPATAKRRPAVYTVGALCDTRRVSPSAGAARGRYADASL